MRRRVERGSGGEEREVIPSHAFLHLKQGGLSSSTGAIAFDVNLSFAQTGLIKM